LQLDRRIWVAPSRMLLFKATRMHRFIASG
jgi:hypothetical protein